MSKEKRLIVALTNYVSVNDVANVIITSGASPIMCDEIEEIEDLVKNCSILLVNIGTINKRTCELMEKAISYANEYDKPVILDPVGVGATRFRSMIIEKWLKKYKFAFIKANISEIKSILYPSYKNVGVDANESDLNENHGALAIEFSKKYHCFCLISGPVDYIAKSNECYKIVGGCKQMSLITGTGCILGGFIASFYYDDISLNEIVLNIGFFSYCGSMASMNQGNYSFRTKFIDNLYLLRNNMNWSEINYEKIS